MISSETFRKGIYNDKTQIYERDLKFYERKAKNKFKHVNVGYLPLNSQNNFPGEVGFSQQFLETKRNFNPIIKQTKRTCDISSIIKTKITQRNCCLNLFSWGDVCNATVY